MEQCTKLNISYLNRDCMNAKEKAEELVGEFMKYSFFYVDDNSMNRKHLRERNAKKCALIAVDEIIQVITNIEQEHAYGFNSNYWQEVKTEIEKL